MRRLRRRLTSLLCLALCLACAVSMSACGGSAKGYKKNSALDTSKPVTLTVASSKETWPEMDEVIIKFEELYPNCKINCEYVETYTDNLPLRLSQTEQKIDIFRTVNIQETTPWKDQALNLISQDAARILDLSGTDAGLVDNFRYTAEEDTQYAIPYGGEMRGMYVNTTLLSKLGLSMPSNRQELMDCCQVLYEAGYVPFQSTPGTFAQQLLYPYICNSIVNGGNYEQM